MRYLNILFALCLQGTVDAADWTFSEPVDLTAVSKVPHFHHLDGASRRHVAPGSNGTAVAWEDDHSDAPQIYVAIRPKRAAVFTARYRLSEGEEAYEPAIVSIGPGRWVAAWEQDGAIAARLIDDYGLGPLKLLATNGARHVTLAADGERLAAVWARDHSAGQLLESAELRVRNRALGIDVGPVQVAPLGEHAYQGYPSATWSTDGRLVIAWEDRRAGHTRLFYTAGNPGAGFATERQLNEHNAPPPGEGLRGGLGSGAMRVMLASDAGGLIRAIWLDKRNPASGYAVWGAASKDGGKTFAANSIVQDDMGAAVPQWHAALAGGPGGFVAAWDDTREAWGDESESGDVILSDNSGTAWSADLVVPVASGAGYQGSPVLALDEAGSLHIVWIERENLSSPSRLVYAQASRVE